LNGKKNLTIQLNKKMSLEQKKPQNEAFTIKNISEPRRRKIKEPIQIEFYDYFAEPLRPKKKIKALKEGE